MVDITAPKSVDVTIDNESKTLWVNVDGECRLRCCRIEHLHMDDRRPREVYTLETDNSNIYYIFSSKELAEEKLANLPDYNKSPLHIMRYELDQ